jgi:hypothetical protein
MQAGQDFTVGNNESLERSGGSAEASAARAGSSVIYLFVTRTLQGVQIPWSDSQAALGMTPLA